ncbi:MAG: glycosyltransferase family 1 protein [Anaerolineales bacterium]|nr:MAG: glycosyltransferase family 1 protein [Anaerolineales bacterium]
MRIAYFTETFLPKIDGIVVTLLQLFDYLEEQGHESMLFAPSGSIEHYAATPISRHRSMKTPFYPELRIATPVARVEKKVLAFKPDLIHLVNPTSLGIAGLRVALKNSIPVVASYQTDVSGFARRWKMGVVSEPVFQFYKFIHNRADINLVPSNFTRKQLVAKGFKRLTVWPGGVDLERFSPKKRTAQWRKKLTGGEEGKVLAIFVSRLSREKRVDLLLPIARDIPGLRLAIVGDGPDRKRLERVFKNTPTVFTGYLRGENLAQAYASGDLFVFTGAEETYGNVVVEAMASGLPVIAPNSGGVVDLVDNGKTGLQYPSESPERLFKAVKKLASDPALLKQMGKAGYKKAQTQSWQNSFDTLFAQYDKALSLPRRAPRDMVDFHLPSIRRPRK